MCGSEENKTFQKAFSFYTFAAILKITHVQ
jgi:hypothetical protein